MDLFFAYLAGILTLINPCVLPVLPIVLASALQENRMGPVALAAGMSVSFVVLGLAVTAIGPAFGIDTQHVADAGSVLMILFGLILLVPPLSAPFERAMARISQSADQRSHGLSASGLRGQFLGGLLLGAVWSPCIGPTLGGAISLASQGESLIWAGLVMAAFSLGVSSLIIGLSLGARSGLRQRTQSLHRFAAWTKPVMGLVFITVGVALLLRLHHVIEYWFLRNMPDWLVALSVTF